MMLIASLNMLVKRWDGEPAGSLTWTARLLGGVAPVNSPDEGARAPTISQVVGGQLDLPGGGQAGTRWRPALSVSLATGVR